MRHFVTALIALALTSGTFCGEDDCLWDNDLIPDGWNGRGVSPPQFPDTRVADNFVIPARDKAWVLRGFHATVIEMEGWIPGTLLEVNIYADGGNCPGALIAQVSGRFERIMDRRNPVRLEGLRVLDLLRRHPARLRPVLGRSSQPTRGGAALQLLADLERRRGRGHAGLRQPRQRLYVDARGRWLGLCLQAHRVRAVQGRHQR